MTDFRKCPSAAYVDETNGLSNGTLYHSQVAQAYLTLRELADKGGRITRVRILTEGRLCDVSYVHGTLPDGTVVTINTHHMPQVHLILRHELKKTLIEWAKAEHVYAKGLGLIDDANISIL